MSVYFPANKKCQFAASLAARRHDREQFRTRHATKTEIENLLNQFTGVIDAAAGQQPYHLFDRSQDAVCDGAGMGSANQPHLDSQIERTLDECGDAIIEVENPRVEFTVETGRVIQQYVGQLALFDDIL